MTRWQGCTRRRFLGGASVALALPLLEASSPAAGAAQPNAPARLVCWYAPNGMHMPAWTPASVGTAFELPLILASLASVRDHVDVLTGLRNAPADIDTAGHHAAGTAGFLTARRARRSESDVEVGISLDQLYAQSLSTQTYLDALVLGLEGGARSGECDNGFSCAYSRNISWSSPGTPRPKVVDPQVAFDLMFGGYDPAETAKERSRRRSRRASILDAVAAEAQAIERNLGSADRIRMDEYLTSIRELERRVHRDLPACEGAFAPASSEPEDGWDVSSRLDAMIDLMVLALRCDATRVITFMLGNSASNRSFDFLGIEAGHHDLSHHAGNPDKVAAYTQICAWEVAAFARLVERLRDTEDGHGRLLDRTLLLFSSELSDGNLHSHDDLPVLLAGGGGLGRTTGRHLHHDGMPIAGLYISMLQWLGMSVERFGDDGTVGLADV